jgi:hypothetical protein
MTKRRFISIELVTRFLENNIGTCGRLVRQPDKGECVHTESYNLVHAEPELVAISFST